LFDAEFYLGDGNLPRFHFNTFPLPMETSTQREFDDRNQEVERGAWIKLQSDELIPRFEKGNRFMSGFQVSCSSSVHEVKPNLQLDKASGATRT